MIYLIGVFVAALYFFTGLALGKEIYMPTSDKPLHNVSADLAFQKVIGVVLREQVALGLLTNERLNAISERAAELLSALATGKVLDIGKDAIVVVRDATAEEEAEMASRPDEFPISKRSKKTLDI